jgi:hypothetical protein
VKAISISGEIIRDGEVRNTPNYPSANESDKTGKRPQRKLFRSHPDEGGGIQEKRNHPIPDEKFFHPDGKPLTEDEKRRMNGPDTTIIPDPKASTKPGRVLLTDVGRVHQTGGQKISGEKIAEVPTHIGEWMEKNALNPEPKVIAGETSEPEVQQVNGIPFTPTEPFGSQTEVDQLVEAVG